jgi:small subunit ribosomal protein S20
MPLILNSYAQKNQWLRLDKDFSLWYNPHLTLIEFEPYWRFLVANHKSALKAIRNAEKKRQRNRIVRSQTRTEIKKARLAIEKGDLNSAILATREAIRQLDKAVTKGVFHRNNAARRKSRLMKRLAQLEAQQKS